MQRTGKQSKELVTVVQNGFYNDAFFLKALGAFTVSKSLLLPVSKTDYSLLRQS